MTSSAALTSVQLDSESMEWSSKEEELFPLALAASVDVKVFTRPFLCAAAESSWTWDQNAWPLPCVPSIALGREGKAILVCMQYETLKKLGAPALGGLDSWLLAQGDNKTLLLEAKHVTMMVEPGTCIWLPVGWLPFVVAQEPEKDDEDEKKEKEKPAAPKHKEKATNKTIMLVMPCFRGALSAMESAAALDVKQNIDSLMHNFGGTQTWSVWGVAARTRALGASGSSGPQVAA